MLNRESLPPKVLAQRWRSIVHSPCAHQDDRVLHIPFYLRTNQPETEAELEPTGLAEWFGNNNPVVMEIGAGFGEWVIGRAAAEPGTNWLAVEKRGKRVLSILRRVTAAGLENVRVISSDVRGYLGRVLPDHALAQVFINYPDPWPKKRHAKRRLISVPGYDDELPDEPVPLEDDHFLQLLALKLRPGGTCHTVTDSANLNQEMKLAFQRCVDGSGAAIFASEIGQPWHLPQVPEEYGHTVYQTVWRAQGRSEHYMRWSTVPSAAAS